MITLKRILVATDFGDASEAAFNYGREFARTFKARLTVLHVAENVLTRAVGAEGYMATFPDLQRDVEEAAQKQAEGLLSDEDRKDLGAAAIVMTSNATALTITTYARETNVDLIIMGTHGRGTVAHLLMGSVAERVVRTAPCPVLTVRHPEHEFVMPDALVAVTKA